MKKSSDLLLILLWCTITVFVYRENSTMLQEVWLIDEHIQYHMVSYVNMQKYFIA